MSQTSGPAVPFYESRTSKAIDPHCIGLSMDPKTPVTIEDDGSPARLHDDNAAESRSVANSRPRTKTARQREDDVARGTRDLIDRTLADLEGQLTDLKDHQARRGQEITNLTRSFEEMGKGLAQLQAQLETLQSQIGELKCDSEVLNLAVLELRWLGAENPRQEEQRGIGP
ncbi:hypothetical protein CLCR_10908 [Cladophialophora carrionii]|uniref:Uncharacterized protein n=1 Tax=Cladophialophora carrionii TaxID=86049 RepID=A0A1C1CYY3_9EURO|nr:hypothetical protein CLCR_10908 [Cladophialophora carrionii]